MTGIYVIKNLENGKKYIGQSSDLLFRKKSHFSLLKLKKHRNTHLQSAWNKYGEESFEFCVIEECRQDVLDVREQAWISYYQSTDPKYGYNKKEGGHTLAFHTEETKAKMSQACTGRHHSIETKLRISEGHKGQIPWIKGKHHSAEAKQKISEASKRKVISDETRLRMSKAQTGKQMLTLRGKPLSEETRRKISAANTGKHHSRETLLKLSESHKGHKLSKDSIEKREKTKREKRELRKLTETIK